MKHLILTISIIYGTTCLSQNPDPQLFQTWYLTFVQAADLATSYNVSEIEPQITPTLIINEDFNFNGGGACNAFEGAFTNVSSDYLETSIFTSTANDCNIQIHNSFESSYFGFLQYASSYQIVSQGEGLQLIIGNPFFGTALFTNITMNTTDFYYTPITIFPNPANTEFYIMSANENISKVQIMNSVGQNIKTINSDLERIDITSLSSGIYLLKIYSESMIINRRLIKM